MSGGSKAVAVRQLPYPFRAMLAICSDLDETPGSRAYFELARFLNTKKDTVHGHGVGLEVGNTIYFDMPADQFSYWGGSDQERTLVATLIRSGHVDCLHSYGDLATTRSQVERSLSDLARRDCRLEVWVDHGQALSNFGSDIMRGEGDLLGSACYHADLTCDFGVRYVWRGRVTSVIGQEVRSSSRGIADLKHPVSSARTVAKEWSKQLLARMGNTKYALHGPNRILQRATLRDGRSVFEFLRCNPHWGGISCGDNASGIADVLVERVLDRLVAIGGVCVLYTHLGKARDSAALSLRTVEAFRRLARYREEGKILVTTTRRLLGFLRARAEISVTASPQGGLDVEYGGPESDLQGLTFHVPEADELAVRVNGRLVDGRRNPFDQEGGPTLSLPWNSLEFPDI